MNYLLDFRFENVGGVVTRGRLTGLGDGSGDAPLDRSVNDGPPARHDDPTVADITHLLAREPSITFLVHGFNVSGPRGRETLGELARRLEPVRPEGVVAVLWPGDHPLGEISYSFEGRDADETARELDRFVESALPRRPPISFVAHSLGCRVTMEAIERLRRRNHPVEEVCLLAPAIDDFSLAAPGEYRAAVEHCARVSVVHSRSDRVLFGAYPYGDLLQAFIDSERDRVGTALGYGGPQAWGTDFPVPANVYPIACPAAREVRHGHYVPDPRSSDPAAQDNQNASVALVAKLLSGEPRWPLFE